MRRRISRVEREHRERIRFGVGDDAPLQSAAERLRGIGVRRLVRGTPASNENVGGSSLLHSSPVTSA
jgi:hypothetical protein